MSLPRARIVPTPRAALLIAGSAPVALLIAVSAPGAWVAAPILALGIMLLVLLDATLAGRVSEADLTMLPDVEVGEEAWFTARARFTGGHPRAVRAALATDGRLLAAGSNARLGTGEFLVAEADESDASFLHLSPTLAVITNIDADHMETYGHSLERLQQAFVDFAHRLPFYGSLYACIDDPGVASVLPKIAKPIVTYGLTAEADIRATDVTADGVSMRFAVHREHHQADLLLAVVGHRLFDRRPAVAAEVLVGGAVVLLAVVVEGVPARHLGVRVHVDGDQLGGVHGVSRKRLDCFRKITKSPRPHKGVRGFTPWAAPAN